MTKKKREARARRQLARMGQTYPVNINGEWVASLDPYTRDGSVRAIQQGRRQLKIVTLRVRNGSVISQQR